MTIQQLLRDKKLSRHQLSQMSGVPWATLSDLCSGKTRLERCGAGTLRKLSAALGLSMEETLALEVEPKAADGTPLDKPYLEAGLPPSIRKAIDDFLAGEREHVSHMDCLWDELYGAINASQWDYTITKEQADFLRSKYLFEDEEDGDVL